MRVLFASHVSDPVAALALRTPSSSDAQVTGWFSIAFRVASRITQVPSGAQYALDMLRMTMIRADLRIFTRYSQTASRAEY